MGFGCLSPLGTYICVFIKSELIHFKLPDRHSKKFICNYKPGGSLFAYPREGLIWEDIDWTDNGECLDLIEKVMRFLKFDYA